MGWKDIEFDLATPSPPGSDASSTGSPDKTIGSNQTWLDAADMNVYGPGGIGAGDQRIVACNDCNKPVLEGALADHRVNCKRAKEIQASKVKSLNGANGTESEKRGLSEGSDEDSSAMAKRAKLGAPADDKVKKKQYLSVKPPDAKKGRSKGPIDVNIQCGVIAADNKPCARSLTCKTHSITQKKEVPGRSAPFKQLLAEWQLRHNPEGLKKQQAIKFTKNSSPDGKTALTGIVLNGRTGLEMAAGAALKKGKVKQIYFGELSDSDASGDDGMMGDSEDEVEQVFAGLTAAKSLCRPIAQPTLGGAMCVRAIKYGRFRDALFGAK